MADYYTLLTTAGIAYETACKAAGVPIKLAQISVGDGNGAIYNPDASAKALKREVWRGPLNALFQDEKNSNWLLAEVTIPSGVGGWYVREAGLWTDTGILYAIVKYPESYKPVLETSGAGKEFYIRSIFETTNASSVTLLVDDTVVKATRAWVMDYLSQQLAKVVYTKPEIDALIAKASAFPVGAMIAFPANNIPPGFLEVDGSVKSAAAYPDLAKFLGDVFNKGNEGAGNFRLPESRGEFLRGWDHGRGIDTGRVLGSAQMGTLVTYDDPSTGASVDAIRMTPAAAGADSVNLAEYSGVGMTYTVTGLNFAATLVTGGVTRPRNLSVLWCIKAWNAPVNQGSIDVAALTPLAAQATEINQGTAKVATQAQADQGLDDATILTPKKMRWGFQILKAQQGYVVFPTWLGGFVLQWGYSQIPSVPTNVQFPLSYPNGCFSVVATPFNVTGGADVVEFSQAPTKNGFSAVGVSSGPTGAAYQPAINFYWLSVGY